MTDSWALDCTPMASSSQMVVDSAGFLHQGHWGSLQKTTQLLATIYTSHKSESLDIETISLPGDLCYHKYTGTSFCLALPGVNFAWPKSCFPRAAAFNLDFISEKPSLLPTVNKSLSCSHGNHPTTKSWTDFKVCRIVFPIIQCAVINMPVQLFWGNQFVQTNRSCT